jgi:hypothetical protein
MLEKEQPPRRLKEKKRLSFARKSRDSRVRFSTVFQKIRSREKEEDLERLTQ